MSALNEVEILNRVYPETKQISRKIREAIENDLAEAYQRGYKDAEMDHLVHKSQVLDKIRKRMRECASVGLVAEKIACARVAEMIGDWL